MNRNLRRRRERHVAARPGTLCVLRGIYPRPLHKFNRKGQLIIIMIIMLYRKKDICIQPYHLHIAMIIVLFITIKQSKRSQDVLKPRMVAPLHQLWQIFQAVWGKVAESIYIHILGCLVSLRLITSVPAILYPWHIPLNKSSFNVSQ